MSSDIKQKDKGLLLINKASVLETYRNIGYKRAYLERLDMPLVCSQLLFLPLPWFIIAYALFFVSMA